MPLLIRDRCPFCQSAEKRTLCSLPYDSEEAQTFLRTYYGGRADLGLLHSHSYAIDACERCGGMWQRSILDEGEMEALYGTWIDPQGSREKRRSPSLHLQHARHCARLLALFKQPAATTLLDYGAGWGEWCEMARAFGFRVRAVELSHERVDHMRARGIDASFPRDLRAEAVDFIYLEQVLEHVPDPSVVMGNLVGMIRDGGYIHIGVPDGKRVAAHARTPERLLRKGPAQPIEHINVFTRQSLITFMRQFHCFPARQREGLLRCTTVKLLFLDLLLAAARILPPSVFPPGTSLLFQKRIRS